MENKIIKKNNNLAYFPFMEYPLGQTERRASPFVTFEALKNFAIFSFESPL